MFLYILNKCIYPNDSAEREKPCNQCKNHTVFHSGVNFPEPPENLLNRMKQETKTNPGAKPHLGSFSSVMNCRAQSNRAGTAERAEF